MKEWHGDDIADEDIVLEEENNEPPKSGDCEKKVAKLKAELDAVKAEKQEYLDGWQRAKADYVNLLKRNDESAKASELKGRIRAIEVLLPALDALERAQEHLPAGRQVAVDREGFLAIAKQLESAFAGLGLTALGAVGEPFDPAIHDALGQDTVESSEKDDTITAVLEKGWRVGDTVIRPAKVRVGIFRAS